MTSRQLSEPELDERLRRTLREVAATIEVAPSPVRQKRTGLRRSLVGLAALAVVAPLTAAAIFGSGPEYVDKLPPDNVIVAGSVDGHRYWMVESFHTDMCNDRMPGVEVVVEDQNTPGQEWDTHGLSYGEPRAGGCGYDVAGSLSDPSLSYSDGSFVDQTYLEVYAVHPDVTAVRVTVNGSTQVVDVHPVSGAGYGAFEVPPGSTEYTVSLLINGDVVSGSTQIRTVPVPLP